MSFRQKYKLVSRQAIHWFPGHMGKGMKQMQQRLKNVDCIVEVHDARIPYSGRNAEFQHTITGGGGWKPHILVLNKKDLIDRKQYPKIVDDIRHREQHLEHILFTNCKDQRCPGVKRLVPLATELIERSNRYNREGEKDFCMMVIGVPNVGKSSLLNVLRNRHLNKKCVAQVGAIAGVTRSVMEKIKISEDPLIYCVDTPGILEPRIRDDEMGMKLALVGCLQDHLVGENLIADYLLYWLNKNSYFQYVEKVGLEKPTDSVAELLLTYANKLQVQRKSNQSDGQVVIMPDLMYSARKFINLFRKQELGLINLDSDC